MTDVQTTQPADVSSSPAKSTAKAAATYEDVKHMLGWMRGETLYGDGDAPKELADLGYSYAKKNCAGAFLRQVSDSAVKSAAAALAPDGLLQVPKKLDPALASACGIYLTKAVDKTIYLYRKN